MDNLLLKLMLGGSTAALFAATAASAQDSSGIEQVVVSASRIQIAGYQQPTPVSVVGAAQLLEAANADVGDTLREMPSMGNSQTPEKGTNGNAGNSGALGISGINLRNLGNTRNLVLLDGQRIVYAGLSAGVDLSVIPSTLVQRVDVVTGGASAAWGSDAVSGVVNLVINKNFAGTKASIDLQDTGQDNRRSYGFTVTNGFDMFGGRSHVEWAVTYNDSPQTVFQNMSHWDNSPTLLANPLYNAVTNPKVPQNISVNNAAQPQAIGGNISNTSLAGIQFGPGGVPMPFAAPDCASYGNATLAPYIATATSTSSYGCYGGSVNQSTTTQQVYLQAFPIQQGTGFFYGSYKITPDIQASLQLNYGYDRSHSSSVTPTTSQVIKSDNAYLPQSIRTAMVSNGLTNFTLASSLTDGIPLNTAKDYSQLFNDIGTPATQSVRELYRAVFTLDGAIGDNWSWNAYYQHSESHLYQVYHQITITQNLANAADAVTVTAANAGKSGLVPGTVACRTTLTNPTNGCSPLDLFGTGVVSPTAHAYVVDNNDFIHLNMEQDSAGASMTGVLPWDLIGAGAPSTAFGVEYRKEAAVSSTDPYGVAVGLGGGNFVPIRGEYNVIEGFAELDIPIIKNGIVESLDGNMAGRMTSYSTSGLVETWKLGLTSQINDDIRLRFTMSYDIRAPNLGELYNLIPTSGSRTDYKNNQSVSTAFLESAGNPNLAPEAATTYSGGIVLTPHWVPGLTMSFDWYSIDVKGIINPPTTTQILNFCQAGVLTPQGNSYCSNFVYNPALVNANNLNGLQFVYAYPYNNGFLTTSGLDFVADYAMDFWDGNLAWHLIGNYNDEETQTIFGVTNPNGTQATYDFAGSMSATSQFAGVPKMHMTLSATYTAGPWTGTVQTRYIGAAQLVNGWTSGVQVDNNNVAQVAYLDLRGTYRWNDNVQFYLSVDNVFDTPPPAIPSAGGGGASTDASQYDILGRMWHGGVRFSF
jgi:iron complex outermembrane receptor protein